MTGADICKEALVEARKLVNTYNFNHKAEVARLICTVHDEIDVECIDEIAKEFAEILEQKMILCGNKYVNKISMKVDTTITKKWQK